jgi:hypothetical protein
LSDSSIEIADLRGQVAQLLTRQFPTEDPPAVAESVAVDSQTGELCYTTRESAAIRCSRDAGTSYEAIGCGVIWSLAASQTARVAVFTGDRFVRLFALNSGAPTLTSAFRLPASYGNNTKSALQISDDGAFLAAARSTVPEDLSVFSLPSGTVVNHWQGSPYFSLAQSTSKIAWETCSNSTTDCEFRVTDFAGAPAFPGPIVGPRLTRFGLMLSMQGTSLTVGTLIYRAGALTGDVSDRPVAWLSDELLLTTNGTQSSVHSLQGTVLRSFPFALALLRQGLPSRGFA